uniref:Uncharacterized protein n=1 Tax=Tanacetum cinerariifolium TaxID=118510 RepID=A0A6L2NRV2_TANCI|nr:hypothetical protein [Tanacetum cinerariifolium]
MLRRRLKTILSRRSKDTPVKRKRILSKEDDRKNKLNRKSKKEDPDSELETDDVYSSSDEVDRKQKKLKIKESVAKKGKKREKKLTPEEAAHEEYLSRFPTCRARITPSSFFSAIRNSRVDILSFLSGIGLSSLHNVSIDQLPSNLGRFVVSNFNSSTYMLSLDSGHKNKVTNSKLHEILGVPVDGYSLFGLDEREVDHEFLVAAQEIDFLFEVNFLTLFTNTMGKAAGLKGQICLDVVRPLRKDSVIFDIDWRGYIYHCLKGSKLPKGTNHYLGPLTFLTIFIWNGLKLRYKMLKVLLVLQKLLRKRKASLEYHGDGKFLALHEKYDNLFKDPISFNDDRNGDSDGDDEDGNGDNDGDDDVNDGDGNRDEEDENEGDKDPNGSNPNFGFTKISLDNFGKDNGRTEKKSRSIQLNNEPLLKEMEMKNEKS